MRATAGLALREIRRSRLRFGLLAGALGLLAFLVLFQQMLLTTLLGYFTGAIEHQSAEVLVYGDQARSSLEASVVDPGAVEQVGGVDGVAEAGPLGVNTFTGELGGELEDVVLVGYDLGGPGAPTTLVEGRLPERDGEGVASDLDADLGLAVGDVARFGPDGEVEVEIVGRARDLRFSVSATVFTSFATYEAARRAVNPDAPFVPPSAVAVRPAEGVDAEALAERIDADVPEVDTHTRDRAVADAPGVAETRQSFTIVIVLAYVVVAIVSAFFFLILTVQKEGPFTLLRALGTKSRVLAGAVVLQATLMAVAGIAIGAAGAVLIAVVGDSDFAQPPEPASLLVTAALLLGLSLLATLPSLRRVRRLDPADAAQKSLGLT